jgi:hypothetical protein
MLPAIHPVPPGVADASTGPWCLWISGRRSCATRAGWVVRENLRPGTTAWCIPTNAPTDIQGYADHVSAARGEALELFVSTPAVRFAVEAYRLGFYQGLGARLVWRSGWLDGGRQPPTPAPAPPTYTVEARWRPSLTLPVTTAWPPGVYLLKLMASDGAQSYVPLVVRDDRSRAALLLQESVITWQAYDAWGGASLYHGRQGFEDRARVVSFDRPYVRNRGSGDLLQGGDQPAIALVERLGLDVSYTTDVDVHRHPGLLLRHRALVVVGHGEYWSTPMRAGATAARDMGVNLLFLEANDVFRHVRMAPSPLGPDRRIIDYKVAEEDPLFGRDHAEVTSDWRSGPDPRPESELLGAMYECNPAFADMVVTDPGSWVFAGTGARVGTVLERLVGSTEYDRVQPGSPIPPDLEILAHSPVTCRGRGPSFSDMTYYSAAASGAGVVDTGTTAWAYRLGLACVLNDRCDLVARAVKRSTENILNVFAAGPAGTTFPSRPNVTDLVAP